jgi:hypothetical protein
VTAAMWMTWLAFAVPGAGEAVPDLLPGGRVQGCGAGPRGEPVAVGEPGDVADVGQDPGGHDRADTGQVHQRRAAGEDHLLELLAEAS